MTGVGHHHWFFPRTIHVTDHLQILIQHDRGTEHTSATILAGAAGNFELNVMMPVMARNLLSSLDLLTAVTIELADKCVVGISANAERLRHNAESSPAIVTPLNRYIGYEAAAAVAHEALATGATIHDVVMARGYVARGEITEEQLSRALDVLAMTQPGTGS